MADWRVIEAVRLTADLVRRPAYGAVFAARLGAVLPLPNRASGMSPKILWQGPNDWLILSDDPRVLADEFQHMEGVVATPASVAEFCLSADQLASGTAVSPAPDSVAVTRFAQVGATILGTSTRYRLFVEPPIARYVEQWLARAL